MANRATGTYDLAEVPPAAIHWIWPGRIARGAIAILESDPGTGKASSQWTSPQGSPAVPHFPAIESHQM